jgi:hypothetical protein
MTPTAIARESNRLHDEFTRAASDADHAAMDRIARETLALAGQMKEAADDSGSLADQVAAQAIEIRTLHMRVRSLSERVASLEDHVTSPEAL